MSEEPWMITKVINLHPLADGTYTPDWPEGDEHTLLMQQRINLRNGVHWWLYRWINGDWQPIMAGDE